MVQGLTQARIPELEINGYLVFNNKHCRFRRKAKKETMQYTKWGQELRKIVLVLCFLALCTTLYGLSRVYAAGNTSVAAQNSPKLVAGTICGYGSLPPASIRSSGDPIPDPRPNIALWPVLS